MQKQTTNPARNFPFRAYLAVEGFHETDKAKGEDHYEVISNPMEAFYAVRAHYRYPSLFGLTQESLDLCEMAVMLVLNDAEA